MCNAGYTLVGNMTRDCVQLNSRTADWSDKAPVCTRMFAQSLNISSWLYLYFYYHEVHLVFSFVYTVI